MDDKPKTAEALYAESKANKLPKWRITNTIHPYGTQTKESSNFEEILNFARENQHIASMITIVKLKTGGKK